MHLRHFNLIIGLIASFSLLVLTMGCGRSGEVPFTITVKGTVTVNGTPLTVGNIVFEPADGVGSSSAGEISEGKFEFQSSTGSKIVIISASRKTGKKGEEFGEDIMESYLPEKYNTQSELTEMVRQADENNFNFELTSEK